MQTRRLRLGDVVDDYCPRERRLSNHVIVAMVDDTIKQTRCSTCDFEHPYKEAKVPPRRKKKDAPSALFQQVLDNVTSERVTPQPATQQPDEVVAAAPPEAEAIAAPAPVAATPAPAVAAAASAATPRPAAGPRPRAVKPAGRVAPPAVGAAPVLVTPVAPPAPPASPANVSASSAANPDTVSNGNADALANGDANQQHDEDNAPLHRRSLIRATLPRPVGEVPVRQPPSFTIREAAAARPNKFRFKGRPQGAGAGGGRQGRPQGLGVSGNQARPGGGRGPQGRGAGKKSGAQPHQHRAGGHQSARGPKGPHGNKRFK